MAASNSERVYSETFRPPAAVQAAVRLSYSSCDSLNTTIRFLWLRNGTGDGLSLVLVGGLAQCRLLCEINGTTAERMGRAARSALAASSTPRCRSRPWCPARSRPNDQPLKQEEYRQRAAFRQSSRTKSPTDWVPPPEDTERVRGAQRRRIQFNLAFLVINPNTGTGVFQDTNV